MSDATRLHYIVAYAGSDAGRAALDEHLAELAALRRVASIAREVVRRYPSYPSWGATEHALHNALDALALTERTALLPGEVKT